MAFESGAVSLRIHKLPRPLPDDIVEAFAENRIPHLDSVKFDPVYGWVTGRHLLDADINADTARYGGWLRLALLRVERKIPAALLKAETRREEFVRMQMNDAPFVSRKQKAEIKEELVARLLPEMPPQLKATTMLYEPGSLYLYTDAMPVKQADEFLIHFRHAVDFTPQAMTPETAAKTLFNTDVSAWMPTSFSEQVENERVSDKAGHDFLTWLWFESEAGETSFEFDGIGAVQILIQGPLKLIMEGAGAFESLLRKGNPTVSREARACLLAGKKLSSCKLSIAAGEEVWEGVFDADEFTTRTLKLPTTEEKLDPLSLFNFRMEQINRYRDMLFGLYERFLTVRNHPDRWNQTLRNIQGWVRDRKMLN